MALGAQLSGYKAHVVMPKNSPDIKKRAVRGYGAQISFCTDVEEVYIAIIYSYCHAESK